MEVPVDPSNSITSPVSHQLPRAPAISQSLFSDHVWEATKLICGNYRAGGPSRCIITSRGLAVNWHAPLFKSHYRMSVRAAVVQLHVVSLGVNLRLQLGLRSQWRKIAGCQPSQFHSSITSVDDKRLAVKHYPAQAHFRYIIYFLR